MPKVSDFHEAARYAAAGLANTAVGYVAFLGLHYVAGVPPLAANAAAYGCGLLSAVLLNRYFVFTRARRDAGSMVRFCIAVAVAFAVNQGVLAGLLGFTELSSAAAQLAAMAAYTLCLYGACKLFVYRAAPTA